MPSLIINGLDFSLWLNYSSPSSSMLENKNSRVQLGERDINLRYDVTDMFFLTEDENDLENCLRNNAKKGCPNAKL